MNVLFKVHIAIDDDSPSDRPFNRNPGIWSLESDYALSTMEDHKLYASLGFDPQSLFPAPLFPLQGTT